MYVRTSTAETIKKEIITNIASGMFLPAETRGQLSVLYMLNIIEEDLYKNLIKTVNEKEVNDGKEI